MLLRFFKQTKLTSFQRQLNLYGFRRITQGPDAGAYYHEMFLKGRPGLSQRMARQKVKGTGHKQPADAQTEPNFYQMSPLTVVSLPEESLNVASNLDPATLASPMYTSVQTTTIDQQKANFPLLLPRANDDAQMYQTEQGTITNTLSPVAPRSNTFRDSTSSSGFYFQSQRTPVNWRHQGSVELLPVSPGLQGAAHLLHGIASGNIRIPEASNLGRYTETLKRVNQDETHGFTFPENSDYADNGNASLTSFLQPRISSPTFDDDDESGDSTKEFQMEKTD